MFKKDPTVACESDTYRIHRAASEWKLIIIVFKKEPLFLHYNGVDVIAENQLKSNKTYITSR